MIKILSDHDDAARLANACLIAARIIPVPKDPDEARAFQQLGDRLGDGLDALPPRPACAEAEDA